MDSTLRLFSKAITWQVLGFVTMTIVGFLFTGSFAAASGIALVGAASGFVAYFLHEMAWSKVRWGRADHIERHANKR
ncbi:DUF2061 domain-containing protein [Algirhabdus cladophorae]|uniref:DUF2061 domain-containing protein n=1 Tax=Algirhabdus cladophorae TaxID=3377108 RepID=UPI003B845285